MPHVAPNTLPVKLYKNDLTNEAHLHCMFAVNTVGDMSPDQKPSSKATAYSGAFRQSERKTHPHAPYCTSFQTFSMNTVGDIVT